MHRKKNHPLQTGRILVQTRHTDAIKADVTHDNHIRPYFNLPRARNLKWCESFKSLNPISL